MGDEIQNANVISIWQELAEDGKPQIPQKWIASIGPEGHGKQATGVNPIEALNALTLKCHWERWPFDLGWQPDHQRARYTPPTPPERPTPTAGAVNPAVPIPNPSIDDTPLH